MSKITTTPFNPKYTRWEALKKSAPTSKLVVTLGLFLATSLTGAGGGDTAINNSINYNLDTSNFRKNLGKSISLFGIPGMLMANGILALLSGMTSRFVYLLMSVLSFVKAKKHDLPLLEISEKINSLEKISNICKKKLNGEFLTSQDLLQIDKAQKNNSINSHIASLLKSPSLILDKKNKTEIEQIFNLINQEQYRLISQGAIHNGERGFFAQIYSLLLGTTWLTVLHDFYKNTKLKQPLRLSKAENLQELFSGKRDYSGENKYIKGKEPLLYSIGKNFIEESKAPWLAAKDLFHDILHPREILDAFQGKNKEINQKAKEELAAFNSKRKNKLNIKAKSLVPLIAMGTGTIGLAFNLLSLVGRGLGFALTLPWVQKYGTSVYNMNSPYYTEENYYQDLKNKEKSPVSYNMYKTGERFLANARYISAISGYTQAFNPGMIAMYGGIPYMLLMSSSATFYGLSGLFGLTLPVAGQAMTIIGTTLSMSAVYGGGIFKKYLDLRHIPAPELKKLA